MMVVHEQMMVKLGGHGLPPIKAHRFFLGLIKGGQVGFEEPNQIYDTVRERPVLDELVGEDEGTYQEDMNALLAQQEAQVAQAQAESRFAMQSAAAVRQQAAQQVQQLQQAAQQTAQRAQQAEQGLAMAQQSQGQMAQQLVQLENDSIQAGQAAIDARMQSHNLMQEHQQLLDQILNWKNNLRAMIDADPVQQTMALRAQQEAQQQQMMAMGGGMPPEAAAQQAQGAPPEAAQQQQMMAQQGVSPEQQQAVAQMAGAQQAKMGMARQDRKATRFALLKHAEERDGRVMVALIHKQANQLRDKSANIARTVASEVQRSRPLARRIITALGSRPGAAFGVGVGAAGVGALTMYLARRSRAREGGSPLVRQAVDAGNLPPDRPLRYASSAEREAAVPDPTVGRGLEMAMKGTTLTEAAERSANISSSQPMTGW